MEPRLARSTLLEVVIPATALAGSSTKFTFEGELFSGKGDKVFIKGIEAISNDFMPFSPLTSGNRVASAADIQNAVVTFSAQNDVFIDNEPMSSFCRLRSNLSTTPWSDALRRPKDAWQIDWTKSFITLIQAPVPVGPFSYMFVMYYGYTEDEF